MGLGAVAAERANASDPATGVLPLEPAVPTVLRVDFGGTVYHDGRIARAGVDEEGSGCSSSWSQRISTSGGSTSDDREDRSGDTGVEASGDCTPLGVGSAM
jgi:hypothetical protein